MIARGDHGQRKVALAEIGSEIDNKVVDLIPAISHVKHLYASCGARVHSRSKTAGARAHLTISYVSLYEAEVEMKRLIHTLFF